MKAVIVSGYFNPLHKGHLELLEAARDVGDLVIVIVNSDMQRYLKGSKEFMLEDERLTIIKALSCVNHALVSIDVDKTQIETLKELYATYGGVYELAFANGGDQSNQSIPESLICKELGIELIDGLGDKIQSSSWLLDKK